MTIIRDDGTARLIDSVRYHDAAASIPHQHGSPVTVGYEGMHKIVHNLRERLVTAFEKEDAANESLRLMRISREEDDAAWRKRWEQACRERDEALRVATIVGQGVEDAELRKQLASAEDFAKRMHNEFESTSKSLEYEQNKVASLTAKLRTVGEVHGRQVRVAVRKAQYARAKIGMILSRLTPVNAKRKCKQGVRPDGYVLGGMLSWSDVNDMTRVLLEGWPLGDLPPLTAIDLATLIALLPDIPPADALRAKLTGMIEALDPKAPAPVRVQVVPSDASDDDRKAVAAALAPVVAATVPAGDVTHEEMWRIAGHVNHSHLRLVSYTQKCERMEAKLIAIQDAAAALYMTRTEHAGGAESFMVTGTSMRRLLAAIEGKS